MEITKAEFIVSLTQYQKFPGIGLPEIAVAGKSNVGKSSLINSFTRRKALAKVSGTPGKTRLINVFRLNDAFHLIDLPGYGYAKVNKQETLKWGAMMDSYFTGSDKLKTTLHLVDIRHDPTADDVQMNAFLRGTGQPFIVVATKADKISRGARMKNIAAICRTLMVQPWQVIPYSSESGDGRLELIAAIEKVL